MWRARLGLAPRADGLTSVVTLLFVACIFLAPKWRIIPAGDAPALIGGIMICLPSRRSMGGLESHSGLLCRDLHGFASISYGIATGLSSSLIKICKREFKEVHQF